MNTPNYIKALLQPTGKRDTGRKVWSIDLELVWLPFFTATNVQGDTAIPREALGAPLRLAKDKDGSVKFSKAGRPVLRVAAEVAGAVRLVKENFTAGLINYAGQVMADRADDYKAEVQACRQAGAPIVARDQKAIEEAILIATLAPKTDTDRVAVGAAA